MPRPDSPSFGPPRDGRRYARPFVVLALFGSALTFLFVWSHARVDRLELALAGEAEGQRLVASQIEFLAKDLTRSTALREVESRAGEEFGLITPDPEQVVIVRFEPGALADPGEPPFAVVPGAHARPRSAETGR